MHDDGYDGRDGSQGHWKQACTLATSRSTSPDAFAGSLGAFVGRRVAFVATPGPRSAFPPICRSSLELDTVSEREPDLTTVIAYVAMPGPPRGRGA
jgi:hypothetical protein